MNKPTFKEYLIEKTYTLDRDVEYLWKKSKLDVFIDAIQNEDMDKINRFINTTKDTYSGHIFLETDSSKLTNRNAKAAHKKNPIKIRVGLFKDGSYYQPKSKFLQISINYKAFMLFDQKRYSFTDVEDYIGTQITRFKNEFTEANVKGSIYHELTHWLDDTRYDQMLYKRVDSKEKLRGKHAHVNHTEFEVNAQIHKIKQLKKSMGKNEFDNLQWEDLFVRVPSVISNFKNFRNEKEYNVFAKRFIKRMEREKVRPKNLKTIPSYREMKQILSRI